MLLVSPQARCVDTVLMTIKNRLQQWLDEKGLNYSNAAEITGVHVQTVRRIAKNQSDRIDLETIEAICSGLNKPVNEFLYQESSK